MDFLVAVNTVLNRLGEDSVASLDESNSSVPTVLPLFEMYKEQLLQQGWYFNKFQIEVPKDMVSQGYNLGPQALAFEPTTPVKGVLSRGGQYLVDPHWGSIRHRDMPDKITGWVTMDMNWEELPVLAQQWVLWSVAADMCTQRFGDQSAQTQFCLSKVQQLEPQMHLDHARSKQYRLTSHRAFACGGDILEFNGSNYVFRG